MTNYEDWLEEAKTDLEAAENFGQAGLYAPACFHLQQTIEKALKALLLYEPNGNPSLKAWV